jgi:hypothetical protein
MGLSWKQFRENSRGKKQWLMRVNIGSSLAMDERSMVTRDRQIIKEWHANL